MIESVKNDKVILSLVLDLVLALSLVLSVGEVSSSAPSTDPFRCTVDGHGPYNLNRKKCLALGRSQAHTNCVLKEKQARVELQYTDAKSQKKGICRSEPKASQEDCTKSLCEWQDDTAQH